MADRGSVRSATFDGFWNGILQRGGWWDTDAGFGNEYAKYAPALSTGWPNVTIEGPTGADTYNLIPFLSNSINDGNLAHLPWLQATPDPVTSMVWDTWIEMNSKTAEEKDIREGDMLEIVSPKGKFEVPVYVHPAVPPWTVSMPVGQGHTSYGRWAEGVGVNTLSILATLTDQDTGALAWAATRVSIRKTGKRIDMRRFEGNVPAIEAEPGRVIPLASPDSEHSH